MADRLLSSSRLHHRAMLLLDKDHRKASPALAEALKRAIQPCSEEVLRQVNRDLDLYPLWDCLALWTEDSPLALAEFHPPLVEVCSKLIGKAETQGGLLEESLLRGAIK